ncbi:MAG: thiol-disulfide oxidoreductase [Planctomycetaceae bacterium]|nr:thiol-disulfide oxidoreductase [Planctomycetaceae bacterium]
MSVSCSPFSLTDMRGNPHSYPPPTKSVLVFFKDDCPTCDLVMPLIERLHSETTLDVFAPGQTAVGNQAMVQRHELTVPVLDDSDLKMSFAYDIETVPLLIVADAEGGELDRLVGFERTQWRDFFDRHAPQIDVDWNRFPDWRPGCGSLSADPIVNARLRAEAEGRPLRARKLEIAADDDVHEFMFDQGYSDGLPVVPPTAERVLRMLTGTHRDPQQVVATIPPNLAPATVEKIAINAVLAGCTAETLPVVIAAIEAVCTDEFNIHGVTATTMGASPVMVLNGPIRDRIGMNMKLSALGQGTRANATIGRAVRLAVRNIGGARPGGTERSTLGNPMKFTMCFAEWEERSPWEPLHVERGFAADDSVVTVFAMTSGPSLIVDQTSRSGPQLAGSIGLCMESAHHVKAHRSGDALLVISPEHLDTLSRDAYTKQDVRDRIQQVTSKSLRELVADDTSGVGLDAAAAARMSDEKLNRRLPKFATGDNIHIVVAGSEAGKFSGFFHGWASGPMGSMPVSKKIED